MKIIKFFGDRNTSYDGFENSIYSSYNLERSFIIRKFRYFVDMPECQDFAHSLSIKTSVTRLIKKGWVMI